MPNDDLGTFPMPPQASSTPVEPASSNAPVSPPTDSIIPAVPSETVPATPPIIPEETLSPQPPAPQTSAFEETPEEIPSIQPSPVLEDEQDKLIAANESLIEKQAMPEAVSPEPQPTPVASEPIAASVPAKSGSITPIIIVVLLIIAGVGLAAAAYLSAQSNKLKNQLSQITQTLERQQTTLTPTATPTIFEVPTPTTTPIATQAAVIATPSATPTISFNTEKILPLANSSSVLKVAINHSPNAQLLLIKVDNATDPNSVVTKYFFREDTTTKKYFFVSISGTGVPELIDKQIYVNPDDNIPSLNDAVLSNKTGLDLDEVLKLTYAQCANQTLCISSPTKAMYVKTGSGIIWQVSIYTKGLSATPLLIQINAETKAINYKSPEFANN